MNLLFVLLEATPVAAEVVTETQNQGGENYLSLLMKGGLIMIPLFLLSLLAIYIIIDRWFVIRKVGKKDTSWISRVMELIYEKKTDKALKFALDKPYASGKVIAAGLKDDNQTIEDVENAMQLEARNQISIMEKLMNYLGITASIAPMLGFLGTIFGVIKIFYNISVQGDIQISTISEGLYEKMICSGAGLFVGIIAYTGFYILNGMIDKVVLQIDKDSNDALKAIKTSRKATEQTKIERNED